MSASLVGSEMCIRDRVQAPSACYLESALNDTLIGRRSSPRALRGAEPVSYTHLTLPTICSV
eukprot:13559516-Alexandrium_andersonii.AAC.1